MKPCPLSVAIMGALVNRPGYASRSMSLDEVKAAPAVKALGLPGAAVREELCNLRFVGLVELTRANRWEPTVDGTLFAKTFTPAEAR